MSHTPNAPPGQLFAEATWLACALITGTGYGIVVALSFLCLRTLCFRLQCKDVNHRRHLFFLLYVCVMFAFGSLFFGSNSRFTQLAFINNRGYPGGPSAFEEQMFSIGADEVSNVSYVLVNWLADSLLVWRCVIICRDFGAFLGRIILIVIGFMQLASLVLGVLFLSQISSPSSSPDQNIRQSINWTTPYIYVSFAINITVMLLIVVRLLSLRRTMVRQLGAGHVTECTTIVAIFIESAAINATFPLLFLVPFAMGDPLSYSFIQVLGETQLIAPLLIIRREALGKGWMSTASMFSAIGNDIPTGRLTDIQFASGVSYAQSTGTHTLESASKLYQDSSGQENEAVEETSRSMREDIELHTL